MHLTGDHPTSLYFGTKQQYYSWMKLNAKQRKTLQLTIESLLVACGAQILEGDGSAIRIVLGNRRAYLHRPHPQKEAKAYQVKAIRELLQSEGIKP